MAREWALISRYADQYNGTDPVMEAAQTIARDYDSEPVSPTTAATLTMLTSLCSPGSALEVGTGTGVSTIAILKGMPPTGVLTSIDVDADKQAVAHDLAVAARFKSFRLRMIQGKGESVLARLAPGGYDFVMLDCPPTTYTALVPLAVGRLAKGGVLVIHQALAGSGVAQPADRRPHVQSLRTVLSSLSDRDDLERVVLPIDEGLCVVRKK